MWWVVGCHIKVGGFRKPYFFIPRIVGGRATLWARPVGHRRPVVVFGFYSLSVCVFGSDCREITRPASCVHGFSPGKTDNPDRNILGVAPQHCMLHEFSTCNKYKDHVCQTCWLNTCVTGGRRSSIREDLRISADSLHSLSFRKACGRGHLARLCSPPKTALSPDQRQLVVHSVPHVHFFLAMYIHELGSKSHTTVARRCTVGLE